MPGDSASCYQLGFELKAVGTAPTAGLDELVAGVQVTTIFYVDTMLLAFGQIYQIEFTDEYT